MMSPSSLTSLSRPPETTPDARETAAQARPAENNAPAPAEARVQVAPSPDTEGQLREAASQIARASSSAESSAAIRNASEAYQSAASARSDMALQQQNNGATSVDMMA